MAAGRSVSRLRLFATPVKLAPLAAILKVGALALVYSLCSLTAVIVITPFMAWFGVDVLAGFGIGAQLEFLLIPLAFSFGAASNALADVSFGANQGQRAHRAGWTAALCWTGALYSAVLAGLLGGLVAVFPEFWATFS